MHALSAWFTRNPVAANLLMALILLAGWLTLDGMRIESFPRIPPRMISIAVVYPGATAAQVDEGVTRKIEQALEGMPGVKHTYGVSGENYAEVIVEKTTGYDIQRLLMDTRTRVDAIVGWPATAERPIITRDEFSIFGLIVQVSGGEDEATLQGAARLVEQELLADPEIANLEIFGMRAHEVALEIDPARIEALGLTMEDVTRAVAANSLVYRSGAVKSGGRRILLRSDEQAMHKEEFAEIPVLTLPDGRVLRLRDLAEVVDGYEEQPVRARYNGAPSVGFIVNTNNKGNLLEVRRAVGRVLDDLRSQLPATVTLEVWADASEYVRDRLGLLRANAWQGLLIILVLLALFLDLKLAVWVALGIPISLAGTVALMGDRFLGHSLNDITTFGMIIVLGILVDDAIVVGESVYTERRRHADPVEGTIAGVHRVATATIFGAMTTIAAFFPLLLIDNDIARIFAGFSVVVIAAVAMSLLESKLILPAHLASVGRGDVASANRAARLWDRVRGVVDRALAGFIDRIYTPLLTTALRQRYAVLLGLGAVAVLGIGLIARGHIETVFFPEVPGNTISVTVNMEPSSPEDLTRDNADRIEAAVGEINARLVEREGLQAPPIAKIMDVVVGRLQVEAYAELTPEAMDRLGPTAVINAWRREIGDLEGTDDIRFTAAFETGGGFELRVVGRDEAMVAQAADAVTRSLAAVAGVHDVRSDLKGGQPELRLSLTPAGRQLGLTTYDLASQIGDGFGGHEVQRMQRGDDEVKVYLRYRETRRSSLHEILSGRIRTPDGRWVPLATVAEIESGYGAGLISRRDRKRAATISATLDKSVTGASAVMAALASDLEEISRRWPGVEVRVAGELEEMGEVQGGLKKAFLFIAALIYVLLAVPLRSYAKPLVIMSVVPFGFVGAAIGHLVMDLPLSILSFFGMMAATGVVVNDSLVLVTRYNQLRSEGLPPIEALIEAGRSRFRAVFLTTVTTVSGLMPLVLETSEQAQYLIPAAVSLAFAELFATPVTLVVVPVLLQVQRDAKAMLGRLVPTRRTTTPAPSGTPRASNPRAA